MDKKHYKLDTGAILASEIWLEATKDELKVLTYMIARGDGEFTQEEIARAAGISKPRVASAIGLWREAGVIIECESSPRQEAAPRRAATVTYEFDERLRPDEFVDRTPAEIAEEIRAGSLRAVMEEIAELLGKPHLNDGEVKSITGLYSDLGLSTEYIRTLALYLSESTQKFSIYKLQRKAALLCDKNITDTELLEKYIADQSATNSAEYEFKSVFGGDIWTRSLTPSEKKYCARWWGELGFSAAIVDMARDISIQNTNKVSLAYMNKCLTAWHDAGLTTIEAIMAQREADALARTEAHRPAAAKRGKKTTDTPTYADFDTDDALMRALERSYGEDKS